MKIVFTGGGTAGHVTPNLALIESFQRDGIECFYIGSRAGIEAKLVERHNLDFYGIASGKLRRYFDWQNFIDPVKILFGFFQALWILLWRRPEVLFSKGGFVAVPVVIAAWILRIPVVIHESDLTPGLANRLSAPFCRMICLNFEETAVHFSQRSTRVTGTPLRAGLVQADGERGRQWLNEFKVFGETQPILLAVGGSLGAQTVNRLVRADLARLTERFYVVHVVGKGGVDPQLLDIPHYLQFEYLDEPYGDVVAASDVVISRAGANALFEFLWFKKPQLLIPLPSAASRGDQLQNAALFEQKGYAEVRHEGDLGPGELARAVDSVWMVRFDMARRLGSASLPDSLGLIRQAIEAAAAAN